ncbi:NAD-dependent succinate-semialdehyde dehydrogenase [Flavobacterium sp. K77]|uniref:NAD-dependent succinate-semialdehyde dehydrogenase n=1 Tax=Flavobacterium sp. K77 TaxID=2910676 RepID=UPI001F226E34|nr:NAD-dependent succinate-semialdehyde dehydrogenase [Flavobacterium sp. K77]MCF6140860.1 NAD-dependent succinate-semialdehyde dehydrogenase [Flavobacterium sp. K77]
MIFKSINPYTQEIVATHSILTTTQLHQKINLADNAFHHWKITSFQERALKMKRLADLLRLNKTELALLITSEMGKVLAESEAEIEKSALNCEYYAEHAEQLLKEEINATRFSSKTVYDPLGAVFAIMPWNYPFWQVFRYAAPTIMAGNVTLLKHAPNVMGCAKAIERLFLEAGFPEGVFQELTIDVPQVEEVIESSIVCGVTLTGSEGAGAAVASLAGKYIKKSVLELGGSDAFIVLDDANLEAAATVAAQSRMGNAGQACICAKRFIITDAIATDFISLFVEKVKKIQQGNPLDTKNQMGSLARIDLAEKLEVQLKTSLDQGAQLLLGGEREQCNFQPTIIDHVQENNIAFREETFGPVAAIVRAKNEDEAIALANQHRYGLAAAIWSEDVEKAQQLARKIEAGSVFINSLVRSDSQIAFGGIKKSGYGRELGTIGLKEFLNVKSIVIG